MTEGWAHGMTAEATGTCGPADPDYATEGYLEDLVGSPGYASSCLRFLFLQVGTFLFRIHLPPNFWISHLRFRSTILESARPRAFK